MSSPRLRLGQLLVDAKLITASALEEVLIAQREDGRRLGTLLVERGLVNETELTQILSHQLAVPWVSLLHVEFSRQLLNLVPRNVAEAYCVIPIYVRRVRKQGDTLYVAMDDPTNEEGLHACTEHAGLPVRAMIAPPSDIRSAIRVYYGVSGTPTRPSIAPRPPEFASVPPAPRVPSTSPTSPRVPLATAAAPPATVAAVAPPQVPSVPLANVGTTAPMAVVEPPPAPADPPVAPATSSAVASVVAPSDSVEILEDHLVADAGPDEPEGEPAPLNVPKANPWATADSVWDEVTKRVPVDPSVLVVDPPVQVREEARRGGGADAEGGGSSDDLDMVLTPRLPSLPPPEIDAVEIPLPRRTAQIRAMLAATEGIAPPESTQRSSDSQPPDSGPLGRATVEIPKPRGTAPRMVSLTLLDGTTIALPAKQRAKDRTPSSEGGARSPSSAPPPPSRRSEPPTADDLQSLTTRDLILALRVVGHGADASDVLGSNVRWESLLSAVLSLLLKKHLIADWEFIDELKNQL